MKKAFVLLAGLLFVTMLCLGQQEPEEKDEKEKGFQKDRLFVGGNFGLSFGNYTFINVSPQLGYRFNRFLAAGAGVNLQYVGIKQKYSNGDLYSKTSQGVAGLNLFGRVYPIQQFMLQVQPEANYVFGKQRNYFTDRIDEIRVKEIVPSLLAGGGLVLPSGRGAFIASLFYDVLQKESSPYGNRPIINFTYNIGL
jgi:hypothetical protein